MRIYLLGDWSEHLPILWELLKCGFELVQHRTTDEQPSRFSSSPVYLVMLRSPNDVPVNLNNWYGVDATVQNSLTHQAYQCGAVAVFPASIPAERLTDSLSANLMLPKSTLPGIRNYERGSILFLDAQQVMVIEDGIIASFIVHEDGKHSLGGLWGKGDILLPHPSDDCNLQLITWTNAKCKLYQWEQIHQQPFFIEQMRRHLHLVEAWASMQSRPYIEQRLMGILNLLGEQFGQPHPHGTLIELRITHQMLASAIGANRTTISRLITTLKHNGKIMTTGDGKSERFILPKTVQRSH
jgi:CRP-like cAMP-binding protein